MTGTAADPMVGTPAPAFCLPDASGERVCLEDYRGLWVVLYAYPRDNTSGCTLEARLFSDGLDAFGALGATVLGVSPDSPESSGSASASSPTRTTSSSSVTAPGERSGSAEKRRWGPSARPS